VGICRDDSGTIIGILMYLPSGNQTWHLNFRYIYILYIHIGGLQLRTPTINGGYSMEHKLRKSTIHMFMFFNAKIIDRNGGFSSTPWFIIRG